MSQADPILLCGPNIHRHSKRSLSPRQQLEGEYPKYQKNQTSPKMFCDCCMEHISSYFKVDSSSLEHGQTKLFLHFTCMPGTWKLKIEGSQIAAMPPKFPEELEAHPSHVGQILNRISIAFSLFIIVSCNRTIDGNLELMWYFRNLFAWADPSPLKFSDMSLIGSQKIRDAML